MAWAHRRSGARALSSNAIAAIATPPDRPTASVELRNVRPRIVRGENLPVLLAGAAAPDGPPLAQPDAVSGSGPRRDQPAHPPVALVGHEQLERRALQQLVGLGPQHTAHIGAR